MKNSPFYPLGISLYSGVLNERTINCLSFLKKEHLLNYSIKLKYFFNL